MTSLVPYASSDEDEGVSEPNKETDKGKEPRKRLAAFNGSEEEREATKAAKVHTSLGVAATTPLKGDWLCYAFVPVSQNGEVYEVMEEARKILHSRCDEIQQVQNPHISLTKPVLVRYHEKDQLLKRSREAVSQFGETNRRRFSVAFSAFTHLPSEDGTRTFWAVEIGLGWQEMQSLTTCLNDKLATLHAREYFKEARFHSSFAWMPSSSATEEQVAELSLLLEAQLGQRLRSSPALLVDKIGVAAGSQLHYVRIDDGL